ncbi:MAG TPA: DUF4142 domain-containing protein, partial [Acetobacteraceae bacterium]
RRFAQMMVQDHTTLSQEMITTATGAGLPAPQAALDPTQVQMLQSLRSARGTQRDRLYVQQQVTAHQQALQLHSTYAQNGDNMTLRGIATRAVPIVQGHLNEIQRLGTGSSRVR